MSVGLVRGGVCSSSNFDLVAGRGLDLVICLNPLSSDTHLDAPAHGLLYPRHWLGALGRRTNRQRLALGERAAA